jgi:hypothetical protein
MSSDSIRGAVMRPTTKQRIPAVLQTGPRPRELILTMLAAGALTFAIKMYGRKTEASPQPPSASPAPIVTRSEPIPSGPPTPPRVSVEQAPRRVPATPPPSTDAAIGAAGAENTELPLAFNVYNRRGKGKVEGFVRNMSAQPLAVTLHVVDASGQPTAQLQLNLAPAEQKPFGTDSGLDIHPGDRVVLQSPPFKDSSVEVP